MSDLSPDGTKAGVRPRHRFYRFTPWLSFDTPGRNPEHTRGRDGIDSPSLPPGDFVSEAMVVAVMGSAQRHRELVAHLASHRAELGETQVVGVSGYAREWVRSDKTVRAMVPALTGRPNWVRSGKK
jgi:hypothetical protein